MGVAVMAGTWQPANLAVALLHDRRAILMCIPLPGGPEALCNFDKTEQKQARVSRLVNFMQAL